MEELDGIRKEFEELNLEVERILRNLLKLRRENPEVRAESAKMLESEGIRLGRMVKSLSREYQDDLLQGISFLKIKMMC